MKIQTQDNPYEFKLDDIFLIGKRTDNPKRSFLFVNKWLGRHTVVNPEILMAAGVLLSSLREKQSNRKQFQTEEIVKFIKGEKANITKEIVQKTDDQPNVLVIGFAEAATGLGLSVASTIKGCTYQATTREQILGIPNLFTFEEEHSHATTHNFFSLLGKDLSSYDEIVLVDDEITTGKTLMNLTKAMSEITGIKKFTVLTILDWRTEEWRKKEEEFNLETGIKFNILSVLSGYAYEEEVQIFKDRKEVLPLTEKTKGIETQIFTKVEMSTVHGKEEYVRNGGRFGVLQQSMCRLEEKSKKLAEKIKNTAPGKVLVLGHGENTYIPSRVAHYMGADFRATTRSPLCEDGNIIKQKHTFEDKGKTYYFYDKEELERIYDKVILIVEQPLDIKLCNNLEIWIL